MFDWNDQELENIIWGEATETGDHIVPYPKGSEERPLLVLGDENKKRWKQETTKQGQKTTEDKTDFHGCQQESISNFETNRLPPSRFCMALAPDLSLSNIAKTDQNSMGTGTGVSDDLNEVTKSNLSRDDTVRLDKDTESFQNRYEDKDQGDFDDYGWANIGSFDDLDRIFSNDDPLFGHVSLGNADELWSASKEVGNSSIKTFPLFEDSPNLGLGKSNDASNQFQTKTECGQQDEQSFTLGCGKLNDLTAHGLQDVNAVLDEVGYAGAKSEPILKDQVELNMLRNPTKSNALIATDNAATLNKLADKVSKRKKVKKCRKKFNEKNKGKLLQDFYGTWSPPGSQFQQFEKQIVPVPSMLQACPPAVLSQQGQLQGRYFLQYQHISSPHVIPSAYRNFRNQYSTMPSLPHMHPGEDNHQRMLSGYDVSQGNADHLNKSLGTTVKPLTMTPQEKIEKLRRRQKIRAMLAIKKQQQQFTHLGSCADPSNKETRFQCIEGADVEVGESLSTLSSLDPNSPVQQDDSSIISMAIDDCSLEDTILYQLQDIIANLDIKVRLCMRDSLFRLAQSALQRHNASDITSTNKTSRDEHDVIAKEETNSHNRYARMPDVETETNPIDRMVAHLLFHKPDSSENIQTIPCQGSNSKPPCSVVEPQRGDQYINSPCIDASENASNNESTDGGAMEVGLSMKNRKKRMCI